MCSSIVSLRGEMAGLPRLFCVLIAICRLHSGETLTPSDTFLGSQALVNDDIYHLFWNYDARHITFEIHVKVKGWVGFGLSPNGGMAGSDIVIGWVEAGKPYFQDYYASGEAMPIIDEQQDWILLAASETSTHTILKFQRPLETCDTYDRDITADTQRVIFAYSERDPSSEDAVSYHGSKRGVRSMMLLTLPEDTTINMPGDAFYVDYLNQNVTVPDTDTTYWCQALKVPEFTEKHHLIKVEPVIQAGHEAIVHHIILYGCYHTPENISTAATGFVCYTPNMPWDECETELVVWAIGGTAYDFPEHAGMPFGEAEGGVLFLRMETHYDNPSLTKDIVDVSGLRLWFTKTLRTYDAGILASGIRVNPFLHILPAGYDSLTMDGHCAKECLSEGMGKESSIKVFSTGLHTHLLGTAVKVHHYRDGVELPLLDSDTNYDFNFQEMRYLTPERTISKGDNLVTECTYNTSSRTRTTYGFLGTRDEMCLAYLFYYPRINITICQSNPTQRTMAEGLSLSSHPFPSQFGTLALLTNHSNTPFHLYMGKPGVLSDSDSKLRYQQSILSGNIVLGCYQSKTIKLDSHDQTKQVPAITSIYKVPANTCSNGNQATSISMTEVLLIAAVTLYHLFKPHQYEI